MLIDAYKKEPREQNWIWLAIILATGPLGSTVYYFTKKRPRDKQRNEALEELYCSDCGEKVKIEDKFCPKCGSVFNEKELISNEEIKINEVPEWLWNVYPLFILLISYLVNVNNFTEGNTDHNIGRVIGAAIVFTIIPFIIIGIRKLFKMKKLSGRAKAIIFYGISFALFALTMCGQLFKGLKN
jgi:hypothetical protein